MYQCLVQGSYGVWKMLDFNYYVFEFRMSSLKMLDFFSHFEHPVWLKEKKAINENELLLKIKS